MELENYLFKLSSFVKEVARIHIDNEEIKKFAFAASLKKYKKNEFFVREGEICEKIIFIHKGIFRYFILHNGVDISKDFAVDLQNPFCTSFTSFINQKPSQIYIEALEESTVLIWDSGFISQLFQSHPKWILFAKNMTELLYIRKEKREIDFLKLSAENRYQQFLINFPLLSQRVPQYHIASYLGLTPESLSRIRARISS